MKKEVNPEVVRRKVGLKKCSQRSNSKQIWENVRKKNGRVKKKVA